MAAARFVIAASVLAVSVGAAHAQNTNTSEVSQIGTDNLLAVVNTQPGNENNRSVALQNGRENRATVTQVGVFNESQLRQIGNRSVIVHTEEGDFQRAESLQSGNDDYSSIRQRGRDNNGLVEQQGDRNVSQIAQGIDASANGDYSFNQFFDPNVGVARAGNANRAVVSQVGSDFTSVIRQRAAAGSTAAASNNSTTVIQRGQGNSSTVVQESRGNFAIVRQFNGGNSAALQNVTTIIQANSAATSGNNPLSNNRADVSVSGQTNSSTVRQNGINQAAEVTQGLGRVLVAEIIQSGSGASNLARIAQSGETNKATIGQDSVGARADIWQQAGPVTARSNNNSADIRQGTGASGTAAFSGGFFGNAAPVTGSQTSGLFVDITQGNNPGSANWNIAQVLQDGVDLSTIVQQAGTGTQALPNVVRVGQQGGATGGNHAIAIQGAGVGPSTATDAAATGSVGDEFYFAGGARSAEIAILQGGSGNSATVEQRGLGQVARVEQGPGSGNLASILQDTGATNATAVIRQTGSGNSYSVTQDQANQYIVVSQTGNGNAVTDVVRRGPGSSP